jgi:hypothetical protein
MDSVIAPAQEAKLSLPNPDKSVRSWGHRAVSTLHKDLAFFARLHSPRFAVPCIKGVLACAAMVPQAHLAMQAWMGRSLDDSDQKTINFA